MKSNVAIRNSSKLESRDPVRRHKMSKPTAVKNGKVNLASSEGESDCSSVNMVAAIQDHISCTKSADLLKIQDAKEDKVALACELDHMYANCGEPKLSTEESQPMKQLKELLLFHLDLVQQQEEQLRAKDRQLNDLREEKQSLKQRLERADSRRTQIKQKQQILDTPNSTNNSNSELEIINSYDMPTTPPDDGRQLRIHTEKGRKRKLSSDLNNCRRNLRTVTKTESTDDDVELNNDEAKIADSNQESLNDSLTSPGLKKEFIQTDSNYFSNYNSLGSRDSPTPDEDVLVPSWRLHPVTSCYQLEGTENLDDEVFLKRHQKLEIDERRRKRWDIQRIREQRMNEKLKRGRSGNKDSSQDDLDNCSFFPNPDEAQYLEVSDTVPVCAFGHPVPNFQPCEFSLPLSFINEKEKVPEKRYEGLRSSTSKMLRTSDGKKGS